MKIPKLGTLSALFFLPLREENEESPNRLVVKLGWTGKK
jgi:hypothetical protein